MALHLTRNSGQVSFYVKILIIAEGKMKTIAISLLMVSLLFGCGNPPPLNVSSLRKFKDTQDYRAMEESFAILQSYGKQHLRRGMSTTDVTALLGEPVLRWNVDSKVETWPYLYSISGTWCYLVGFVDGQLEYWGNANPQWFLNPDYELPGGDAFLSAYRNEFGKTDSVQNKRLHKEEE